MLSIFVKNLFGMCSKVTGVTDFDLQTVLTRFFHAILLMYFPTVWFSTVIRLTGCQF